MVLASAFSAGHQRMRAMLKLGGLYALGFTLVLGFSALFDGGQFARVYTGNLRLTEELALQADFQAALWAAMALYAPLSMLFWHAPALVHWHGVPPIKSLFFSGMACWKNKGAMLVFGMGWLGVFLGAGLFTSLISVLAGSADVGNWLTLPLVVIMAAMFFTSSYFSFRDSFIADPLPGDTA
jgi:Mg2+/citrate symporter